MKPPKFIMTRAILQTNFKPKNKQSRRKVNENYGAYATKQFEERISVS
jgi:hypothetical protein